MSVYSTAHYRDDAFQWVGRLGGVPDGESNDCEISDFQLSAANFYIEPFGDFPVPGGIVPGNLLAQYKEKEPTSLRSYAGNGRVLTKHSNLPSKTSATLFGASMGSSSSQLRFRTSFQLQAGQTFRSQLSSGAYSSSTVLQHTYLVAQPKPRLSTSSKPRAPISSQQKTSFVISFGSGDTASRAATAKKSLRPVTQKRAGQKSQTATSASSEVVTSMPSQVQPVLQGDMEEKTSLCSMEILSDLRTCFGTRSMQILWRLLRGKGSSRHSSPETGYSQMASSIDSCDV